jgi:hypothetical protein
MIREITEYTYNKNRDNNTDTFKVIVTNGKAIEIVKIDDYFYLKLYCQINTPMKIYKSKTLNTILEDIKKYSLFDNTIDAENEKEYFYKACENGGFLKW